MNDQQDFIWKSKVLSRLSWIVAGIWITLGLSVCGGLALLSGGGLS